MLGFDKFCYYGKISDVNDFTARLCYDAAIDSARDAGIPEWLFADGHPKLELYVYALALHWYDNRGFLPLATLVTTDEYSKRMINKMVCELRYLPRPED